jgi:hypothetical protein
MKEQFEKSKIFRGCWKCTICGINTWNKESHNKLYHKDNIGGVKNEN